jgi:hypothetical protein
MCNPASAMSRSRLLFHTTDAMGHTKVTSETFVRAVVAFV